MRQLMTPQQQIMLAQRRLHQAQIPRGARGGAMAGQMAVPQGADDGTLAGCGPGGCNFQGFPSPFAGMPVGGAAPYLQPGALLGIFVQPATSAATTLEISCGNTFFNSCGARSFGDAEGGENLLTSIISGFDTRDQLCPGSGIDVAFFNNQQACYCPFYFGCFSNLAPLMITFDPVDTQSSLAPLNMVLVGDRLEFDGCFPYPPAGVPPTMPPGGGGGWGGGGGGGTGVQPMGPAFTSLPPAATPNPGWKRW